MQFRFLRSGARAKEARMDGLGLTRRGPGGGLSELGQVASRATAWMILVAVLLVTTLCAPASQSKDSDRQATRAQVRHLLNRVAYGPRPGDIERVLAKGIDSYIAEQLSPKTIKQPRELDQLVARSQALTGTPAQLFMSFGRPAVMAAQGIKPGKRGAKDSQELERRKKLQMQIRSNYMQMYREVTDARIMRAVYSPRQLQEVMTEFWYNHFNVSFNKGLDHLWIGTYEETAIRPHALGRFRDLLGATAHHAAMLFYLDNWQNTSEKTLRKRGRFRGINENYARELMELHTLGVDGGYTQDDVVALARILTGHGLLNRQVVRRTGKGIKSPTGYYFDRRRHDFSDKEFLGHRIRGEGKGEIDRALDILADHPSTARFISFKLAQYFVADDPPATLVDKLASTYMATKGDIRAMIGALLGSDEFWSEDAMSSKFKTPYRYVISSLRATNSRVKRSRPLIWFLRQQGMPVYQCQTPDGYKNTQKAWLNPTGLIQRIEFATALGSGRFPAASPRERNAHKMEDIAGISSSSKSHLAVAHAPAPLATGLILGSPEFMMH